MSPKRYITNTLPTRSIQDTRSELMASILRIVKENPPNTSQPADEEECNGLYTGPTSIAYMFLALSRIYPYLKIEQDSMKDLCIKYLLVPREGMTEPYGSDCGIGNEYLAHTAVSAAVTQNYDLAWKLCGYSGSILKEGGSDEWLYGRAGYLYLLRLVKSWMPPDDQYFHKAIDVTAKQVIERIFRSPRPWKWHGKLYYGAVHGMIGIITQIVLTDPSQAPRLETDLAGLLVLQTELGNWPSSQGSSSSPDKLVQFCHGAPGFATSLESIKKYFPRFSEGIDAALSKSRQCIWSRGLLHKDPNICHGIAGNALAFRRDDPKYRHFLSFMSRNEVTDGFKNGTYCESDAPFSLMCGEAGRSWVWALADTGKDTSCIGYNDV